MNTPLKPGAVVFAKEPERLAAFYEALLTLPRVHAAPGLVVLGSAAFELVLHGIPPHIADTFTIQSPPERRQDTPMKLFFTVDNLADARRRAPSLGGLIDPPDREWAGPGYRACDGHDPEGNVVQFREACGSAD